MTAGQLTKRSFMCLGYECLYLHIRIPNAPQMQLSNPNDKEMDFIRQIIEDEKLIPMIKKVLSPG